MKIYKDYEDGAEIARDMGISRQAVSNTLKRAMKKVYISTQELNPGIRPFETAVMMMKMFEVIDSNEVNKFFHLFPPNIRDEIRNDVIESRKHRKHETDDDNVQPMFSL